MASVVISSAATEAAFWITARTTLVGSMMPLETKFAGLGVEAVGVLLLFQNLADDHRTIFTGI